MQTRRGPPWGNRLLRIEQRYRYWTGWMLRWVLGYSSNVGAKREHDCTSELLTILFANICV